MCLLTLLISIPMALDGESVNASNTGLAVLSVVSIVFGYVFLVALWYFVFRKKAREGREEDRSD